MYLPPALQRLWKKAMLRSAAFSGKYRKLKLLYTLEDPWDMASEREQHRFSGALAQLREINPRYSSILELGCGEGHQSLHLQNLTDRLYGIDLSATAIARAEARCPTATFAVAEIESAAAIFPSEKFDLITACEVLYYTKSLNEILPAMQARTRRIYVSNYLQRSELMRTAFTGPGWRQLNTIRHGETVWECFLWEDNAT
ncbi:MAG: class I SAM-dependent methyltransferase [Bradyrhizobium sp.]|nr:class I SAM-dependent methyltransferase [Bradyrhizobium sp.]